MKIHHMAVVNPRAELGNDVEIGPYSIVAADVRIAAGSVIGPHVVICPRTSFGKRNRVFQFASIGEAPQDRKYAGEPTRTVIGDDNKQMQGYRDRLEIREVLGDRLARQILLEPKK